MKRKLNKISMILVAMLMFGATMFLNMSQNEQGKWEFGTLKAIAQGGENPSNTKTGTHSNLQNSRGFSNVNGMYTIFNPPGSNPGSASVVLNSTPGNIVWTKTNDYSTVGTSSESYHISYKADYTYGSIGTGNLVVNDGKVVVW